MLKHNNFIITESQHRMLTESAAERFVDRLITNNLPENARQYADTTIGELVKSHPDILSRLPLDTADEVLERFGGTKLKDFIRISIMKQFDMHGNAGSGKGPVKYMRGIFRIVLDELKLLQRPDMNCINRLKDNVLYIMNAANDGDEECLAVNGDLNGMSEEQLDRTFRDKRKAFFAALRARMSSKKVDKSAHKYTKVPILRHEDAVPFQPYTDWCIAFSDSSNYDGYTNGGRRFYVFLRDDYKDFGKKGAPRGENCPLDDYGMSMVSVLVNIEGHIDIVTTRWNHANDGEFNPPDEETLDTIQREMGVNLYAECPPYSREELRKMGIIPFNEIQAELDKGVRPEDIFEEIEDAIEGFSRVYVNGKWSLMDNNTNKLIGDGNQWYEYAYDFSEGYAEVQREDGKWSFIDKSGKLIGNGNVWYEEVDYFHEDGYAKVWREDWMWSFIDRNGKLIGDGNQWYKYAESFSEGYAEVQREDGKWSFIDGNRKLIGDGNQWYKEVKGFSKGYAVVQRDDGKWSFIDRNGKLIGDGNQWYKRASEFSEGYARVQREDDKCSFIDKDGKLIGDGNQWYLSVGSFSEGYAKVRKNGKWSLIDRNGKLIGDGNQWYEYAYSFSEGYAVVLPKEGKYVYLSRRGNEFASKEEARADSERLAMAESVQRRFVITESQRNILKNTIFIENVNNEKESRFKRKHD